MHKIPFDAKELQDLGMTQEQIEVLMRLEGLPDKKPTSSASGQSPKSSTPGTLGPADTQNNITAAFLAKTSKK